MLDDHDGGVCELGHRLERRIGVVKIVVGKFLALKLFCARETLCRTPGGNVKRRGLVRIFAIAHGLAAFERHVNSLRQFLERAERDAAICRQAFQFRRDLAVVAGRARVGFPREPEARRKAQFALAAQLRGDRRISAGSVITPTL